MLGPPPTHRSAGEGRYEDGTAGSPIFFAEAARKLAPPRTMELIFIEEKKARYEKLCQVLAEEASDVHYDVWQGPVEKHLDDVLTRAAGVPFFAFLDPCGLGLPFTDIADRIFGRPYYQYAPATEVLLNFSAEAVRRIGGRLKEKEDAPGRAATLARMDAACGGDWWRELYVEAESPEQANERIASKFATKLREATGAGSWVIEVRNAEHQQPRYALVFLSRHPDGLYLYGNAMSSSQQDWRRAVVPPGSLLDDDAAFKEAEDQLAEEWIATIAKNVEGILETYQSFKVNSKYGKVMGSSGPSPGDSHSFGPQVPPGGRGHQLRLCRREKAAGSHGYQGLSPKLRRGHLVPTTSTQQPTAGFRPPTAPLLEEEGCPRRSAGALKGIHPRRINVPMSNSTLASGN